MYILKVFCSIFSKVKKLFFLISGGVEEQLKKLLPKGLIDVGKVDEVKNLTSEWISKPPEMRKNNFFTLGKMLQNTLSIYKKEIKKRDQNSRIL